MMKKAAAVIVCIVLLIPIATGVFVYFANNYVAKGVEKKLSEYQLPPDTVILDSLSIAKKLEGNGNGMQYTGVILVESKLSKDELTEYYEKSFVDIEVREQKDSRLTFTLGSYTFDGFDAEEGNNYFSVICRDYDRNAVFGDFWGSLLDIDLRGH